MNQNPAPAPVWYNTTGETEPELSALRASAASQQERVKRFMQTMRGHRLTAWHVQRFVMPDSPITSARRCLTNLTTEGFLKVVGQRKAGPYSHTCNEYTVAQ